MTDTAPPPIDWAGHFDILEPSYVREPAAVWSDLRSACPVAHSDRYGSTWLPVIYADLSAIAHDVERFSSRDVSVITPPRQFNVDPDKPLLEAPPITSDPPIHTWARRLLLPAFGPSAIDAQTPITKALANELIDGFGHLGEVDAASAYAQHIPPYG